MNIEDLEHIFQPQRAHDPDGVVKLFYMVQDGEVGMRLQIRPHNIVDVNNNSVFIEPIWVFRKNNNKYIVNVLDELFTFE